MCGILFSTILSDRHNYYKHDTYNHSAVVDFYPGSPPQLVVDEDENVTLNCTPTVQATVQWDGPVDITEFLSSDGFSITFPATLNVHEGFYSCEVIQLGLSRSTLVYIQPGKTMYIDITAKLTTCNS